MAGEMDRPDFETEMRAERRGLEGRVDKLLCRVKAGDDDGCEG